MMLESQAASDLGAVTSNKYPPWINHTSAVSPKSALLSRTTYFFTEISFAAMIVSVVRGQGRIRRRRGETECVGEGAAGLFAGGLPVGLEPEHPVRRGLPVVADLAAADHALRRQGVRAGKARRVERRADVDGDGIGVQVARGSAPAVTDIAGSSKADITPRPVPSSVSCQLLRRPQCGSLRAGQRGLPSGIARSRKVGGLREVIWGGRVGAAKINAESARQRAKEAAVRRIIAQCLKGGYDWSEVMRRRRETRASIPFDAKHSKRVRSNLDQLG
jgi:hypothetical protein